MLKLEKSCFGFPILGKDFGNILFLGQKIKKYRIKARYRRNLYLKAMLDYNGK